MSEATTDDVVLRLEDVTKVYSGTVALKQASIDIRKGAVNVLVGENGAGKSTMMKIIAGVEQPTLGRILLDGAPVQFSRPADAEARGICMVFQELNLLGNLSVAENIFMSREVTRFGFHVDHGAQRRRAEDFLARLEVNIRPDMLVEDLTIGQQQLVEIAKAVSLNSRVIIFDEPTSALSAAEVDVLFRVIGDLKRQGVAIVYISHRLEELIRIGDYITVLRDGRVTGHDRMANVDMKWIIRQMIGSDAKDFSQAGTHSFGDVVMRCRDISLPRMAGGLAVDRASVEVRAGEILGIYGLMGAGRSELLECIMGRHGHARGRVEVGGRDVTRADTAGRIAAGLAHIPEDRQRDGLISILSIAANITLSSLARLSRWLKIDLGREREAVAGVVRDLSVKVADPRYEVSSLSGGNQQKVVIGKALLTRPRCLLMDEPSRGIDVGAKADVFRTMRRLAAEGMGIVFVTSDLDEVMALSDRIAVMSNGRLVKVSPRSEITEAEVVSASAEGHKQDSKRAA
ncbi:MAG: sugar ABC transporter ATP-binding protein [Hyphomicrobiales bacterium]